jgi:hypothetical protein
MENQYITKFEDLGWFLEYLVGNKLVGTKNIAVRDREEVGYLGTRHEVAADKIILERGKFVKKGAHYRTRMYPLCGKIIKK